MGRKPGRETACVLDQGIACAIDAVKERDGDPVDRRYLGQRIAVGMPDERVGAVEVRFGGVGRPVQGLDRIGDASEQGLEALAAQNGISSSKSSLGPAPAGAPALSGSGGRSPSRRPSSMVSSPR